MRRARLLPVTLLAVGGILAGCGGGGSSAPVFPTSDSATAASTTTIATTGAATTVATTVATTAATTAPSTSSVTPSTTTAPTSRPTTTAPAGSPTARVVEAALQDLDAYWKLAMPTVYKQPWTPVSGGFFAVTKGSPLPPCPGVTSYADVEGNAFYCPKADLVAWDDGELMPRLQKDYGDFTLGIVIAHEFGHAIQARIDYPAQRTVTREQQADCFAGAWVASVANGYSTRFSVKLDDLDNAIAGFLELRDEPGDSADDKNAHGSAFDRIGAFQDGVINGAPTCARYTDDSVARRLVEVPYSTQEELDSGGNLAWADVVPLVVQDLEDFWTAVFDELGWGDVPEIDPLATVDMTLARTFYDRIGDFAAATLIARSVAGELQKSLGVSGSDLQLSLSADCEVGVWAASMFLQNRPNAALKMSPGDLDKAVVALLASGDDANKVGAHLSTVGTAFQRVSALRSGFIKGIKACNAANFAS